MAGTNGVAKGREAPKQEKQRPVHEVRLGRIKAAIWSNSTEKGVRYGVTLGRIYKDQEDGEWQTSTSFGRDDLLLVAKVCELAILWIFEQGQESADVPF